MRTVSYRLGDLARATINIGKVAENEYTRVQFNAEQIFAEYPAATAALSVINPAGTAYPAVVTREGDLIIWDVTDADLTAAGQGELQLTLTENGVVIKSYIARTRIERSIVASGSTPDPVQNWLDEAAEVLEEVQDAIPAGGTQGQVLGKLSDDNYDLGWIDQTGGGGGGGTSNYNELSNKPQIAGTTLSGNKSLEQLGIASADAVSAKYTKPSSGIPSSDMASGVQTSLGKADSAYQKPSGGIPASDLASGVIPDVSGFYTKPQSGIPATDIADGVIPDVSGLYTKPSGGIPKTDLASAVQTSLGKADTAYQKPSGGIPAADIASGVIPVLTDLIDDTAGDGDTNKVWSADKSAEEVSTLSSAITELEGEVDGISSDIQGYVEGWLDDHPEATTTVQDGSITDAKLARNVKAKVDSSLAFGKINFLEYTEAYEKRANSYRLNESDGYCTSDSDYCLLKYPVTAGELIRVVSDDRFQFQTTYTTNVSGANYKVGDAYGTGDYSIVVPSTATWLVVSTTKANSGSAVYKNNIKENKLDKYPQKFTTDKFINYSNGNETSFTGLNFVALNVVEGIVLQYDYTMATPDSRGVAFYDSDGGKLSGVQAIATTQEITVPAGAVLCKATVITPNQIYIKDVIDTIFKEIRNVPRTSANPLSTIKETISFLRCFLHVGCIGDSLASGASSGNEGGSTEYYDIYEHSWGQYLARATGNTYYNFSRGGLTSKTWNSSTYATTCFDGNHKCEAYIIGLAVNDWIASMSIGTSEDINLSDYSQNADSFYGNYGKIIQRIKEHQPKAKIFVITAPDSTGTMESQGYNPAIRAMATIFDDVYVVDLYTYASGIIANGFLQYTYRSGHYNAIGYQYISRLIATYIDWIIENNPSEFDQIEFIGTDHSWTST